MEDKLSDKIHIDEKSEELIRFNFRQYQVLTVLWILFSALSFAMGITRFTRYYRSRFTDWRDIFNLQVYAYIYLAMAILGLVQLYFYFNGIRYQKKAITESDQSLFTRSFQFYKTGNFISICLISVNLFCQAIFLYQEL
jgi:hypothetical protein